KWEIPFRWWAPGIFISTECHPWQAENIPRGRAMVSNTIGYLLFLTKREITSRWLISWISHINYGGFERDGSLCNPISSSFLLHPHLEFLLGNILPRNAAPVSFLKYAIYGLNLYKNWAISARTILT